MALSPGFSSTSLFGLLSACLGGCGSLVGLSLGGLWSEGSATKRTKSNAISSNPIAALFLASRYRKTFSIDANKVVIVVLFAF